MLTDILFPAESQLRLKEFDIEDSTIMLTVFSTQSYGCCPHCGYISTRIHSYYQRQPADLPLVGYAVSLNINVRRFFCDNPDCESITFGERMPDIVSPYAHRTNRLAQQQQQLAFALGGEAGARLLAIIGMKVSSDTLIRLIRNAPETEITTPRVFGVDDWAKRKGQSYGTILVDLETQRPIDLLPDRSVVSFTSWLKAHPGVEVISRDRGTEYIKGATDGAPEAIQVADRWHLLTNLRDALKRLLDNKRACLKAAADWIKPSEPDEVKKDTSSVVEQPSSFINDIELSIEAITPVVAPGTATDVSTKLTRLEQDKHIRHLRRQERYDMVMELHKQGFSSRKIACQLSISPRTVRKYIKAEACPMYPDGIIRPSKLDNYMDYIRKRLADGCRCVTQIWREISNQGFDGSRGLVSRYVAKERKSLQTSSSSSNEIKDKTSKEVLQWSSSRASWLLVKPMEDLSVDDHQALERIQEADAKVAEAYTLGQRFVRMVKERQSSELKHWLDDVGKSGIEALKGFAKGIEQDLAAVTNALSLPWSNGQTEGQVNRLKLIKRQMYGRANFDLLRKRVLANTMRC
jgi:transposase